jgi:hypothetical protein
MPILNLVVAVDRGFLAPIRRPHSDGYRYHALTPLVDSLVDDGRLWDVVENALDELFACQKDSRRSR